METEKLIYDVFIGYHGTFDSNGSYAKAKLIELLEDKAFSKIYHISDGFETMVRCARRFKTFGEDVTALLNALLAESQQLADISDKSNEPQPRLIESIDRNVKALIALLRA